MIFIPAKLPPTPPRQFVARVSATAAGDQPVRSQSTINVIAYDQEQAERAAGEFAQVTYPRRDGWRVEMDVSEVIL